MATLAKPTGEPKWQSGGAGRPPTTTIFRETGGNSWEYLGRLTANNGVTVPTLTFTHFSGLLSGTSRMYSDAIKFVFVPPPQPPVISPAPTSKRTMPALIPPS